MKIDSRLPLRSVALLAFATLGSHSAHAAAILFVGGPAAPNAPDANAMARLTSFGNVVTYISAPASTTASATGQNGVIVSSSVTSADVADKFANLIIGVISWEQAIQQQSRHNLLTEAAERNSDGTFTQLTITAGGAASPLAAGLGAGIHTVTTIAGPYSYGNSAGFGAGATGVAVRGDGLGAEATRFGIYGYNTGGLRPDGTPSPGRRVHFFMADATFDQLTPSGLKLFDAAAQYLGATIPEPSIAALAGMAVAALLGRRTRRLPG